mmetsp:Transcript_27177/g.63351  ORF Transcript_27177/g.63351 Transcript_27177/m.63351 type:complete len:202 (-) Transcript_27177:329-934(-)
MSRLPGAASRTQLRLAKMSPGQSFGVRRQSLGQAAGSSPLPLRWSRPSMGVGSLCRWLVVLGAVQMTMSTELAQPHRDSTATAPSTPRVTVAACFYALEGKSTTAPTSRASSLQGWSRRHRLPPAAPPRLRLAPRHRLQQPPHRPVRSPAAPSAPAARRPRPAPHSQTRLQLPPRPPPPSQARLRHQRPRRRLLQLPAGQI